MTELVSIIMPAYNAESFIEEAINAVIKQSYLNWELIVVDDGSNDSTANIVKKIQLSHGNIIYVHQKNKGLGSARNYGIKTATGRWIAFLDSDDLWKPNKLEVQINASQRIDTDIIFSSGYYLNEKTQVLSPYNSWIGIFSGQELYPMLLRHNNIPVLSVLIKKSLAEKIGLQDTNVLAFGNEDWDYWLRASKENALFLGLEEKLFEYRVHEHSMSQKSVRMRIANLYVLNKNYTARLLTKADRDYFRMVFVNNIPFLIKNLISGIQFSLLYISLLFKITGKYLPSFLIKHPKLNSKTI